MDRCPTLFTEKVKKIEPRMRRSESRGIGALKRKMLQFLRMERAFDEPFGPSKGEEIRLDAPPVPTYSKQMESALLEAERKKAEAMRNWERHRIIC